MNKYSLQDDQGRTISTHADYESAVAAAEEYAGADGVVGHDGDLSFGGDKTLIWSDEESSEGDPGVYAIGAIRVIGD